MAFAVALVADYRRGGVVVEALDLGFRGPCGEAGPRGVFAFDDDPLCHVAEAGYVAAVFDAVPGAAFDPVVNMLGEVFGDLFFEGAACFFS